MQKIFFIFCLTTCALPAAAQNGNIKMQEDSVKMVIEQFFKGFNTGDTSLLLKTVADSMTMQTVAIRRDGQPFLRPGSLNDIIIAITKRTPNVTSMEERIVIESVKTDGQLASVWTPYQFFLNGKIVHCGVNAFQLIKLSSGWRIVSILDTRRRQGCE